MSRHASPCSSSPRSVPDRLARRASSSLALVASWLLAGCPSGDDSSTSAASTAASTVEPMTTTMGADTTTGGSSAGVCDCFHTTGGHFSVSCPFTGHTQCGSYQHCWEGGGGSTGGEPCPSPALEAANAEVVDCVLALLASGEPGRFGDFASDDIGQFSYGDSYVANGDGTIETWSSETQDLDHEVSAVELRQAPAAMAVEPCTAQGSIEAQWTCIETVAHGALIETCTDPVSWSDV